MHTAINPAGLSHLQQRGCVATIGNFDGVHVGHQRLIERTVARARERWLPSLAITFDPHPLQVILQDKAPLQLMSLDEKLQLFADMGVDHTLVLPFSLAFAELPPETFVQETLARALNVKHLCIGHDYAFGKHRRGNAELLHHLGSRLGFRVEQLDPVCVDGQVVSSTCIRDALLAGNLDLANRLLGRPHSIVGRVIAGLDRGGRMLGFPTANMIIDTGIAVPASGVYAVLADIGLAGAPLSDVLIPGSAQRCMGAGNVGVNPTFGDTEEPHAEIHLLDFDRNIYYCPMRVQFMHRLRNEKKFDSVEELISRIADDVKNTRAFFAEMTIARPASLSAQV